MPETMQAMTTKTVLLCSNITIYLYKLRELKDLNNLNWPRIQYSYSLTFFWKLFFLWGYNVLFSNIKDDYLQSIVTFEPMFFI